MHHNTYTIFGFFLVFFVTCTSTSRDEIYYRCDDIVQSEEYIRFDSLIDSAMIESDSIARAFDSQVMIIKNKRRVKPSKKDTTMVTGHPFGNSRYK